MNRGESTLWKLDVVALSKMLDEKAVSPVELLQVFLERCERLNPLFNALVTVDADQAMRSAVASEQRRRSGRRLSPLDGIPLSVKDNLFVGGMRATWGSKLYADFMAPRDDIFVERLRAAGAVIVGKTNTPEFALAAHTQNALFGATRNPWDVTRVPAGSSGGAAATVAAGMLPLAVGTDAGGSIRLPAAYCGLVGLKPTVGRIPRRYGFPPIATDFQVIGVLARSVGGVSLLLEQLAGPDLRDRASLGFPDKSGHVDQRVLPKRALRVGWVTEVSGEPIEPDVARCCADNARVLGDLGHEVIEISAPYDLAEMVRFWSVISSVGLARAVSRIPGWADQISPPMRVIAEAGLARTGVEYVDALDRLNEFRARVSERFDPFDLLLTPTSPVLPWPIDSGPPATVAGQATNARTPMAFTTFVNATGYPAVSLPCGTSAQGLPIGIQLVGKFSDDRLVLNVAESIESIVGWQGNWPPTAVETLTIHN